MRLTAKLNNVTIERTIPEGWDQVTFGQLIDLSDCGDDRAKALSVFLKIDAETIRKAQIVNLDAVLAVLSFLETDLPPSIPETILGYKLPKDLGFETVGQYQDLKDNLKASHGLTNKEALEKYMLYVSVYACSAKHGHYDWKLAEDMASEFLQAPCTEVMGIGNFTLAKLIGSTGSIKKSSRSRSTLMKKFRLVLTGLRLRLDLLGRSITSSKSWGYIKRRSLKTGVYTDSITN